jgi:hypothetical protein
MSTTELKGTVILATDTSAKVGIGTTSPTERLEVNGTIKTNAVTSTSGTSQLLIANDARSYGGDIIIGGGGITGNSGVQTAGIRIGDGLNGIHSYIQVGSTTMENIYLATKSIGNLFLNYGDNGNVYVGKASSSGELYIGKPITFGWSTKPTANTQLGYRTDVAQVSNGVPTTDIFNVGTVTISQAGCYLVNANIQVELNTSVAVTGFASYPSVSSTGLSGVYGAHYQSAQGSFVVNTNGSYSQVVPISFTTGQLSSIKNTYFVYSYTRIG